MRLAYLCSNENYAFRPGPERENIPQGRALLSVAILVDIADGVGKCWGFNDARYDEFEAREVLAAGCCYTVKS
jgi:hypothetical protein